MLSGARFLAADLGASSGRIVLGCWDGNHISLEELHRFRTGGVQVGEALQWNVLGFWMELQQSLARYRARFHEPPAGISVDAWGVDFALLDRWDRLVGNPYHYRDPRTLGIPEIFFECIASDDLFLRTGVQPFRINTLFQLFAMVRSGDPQLLQAATLLMIPDFFHHCLSGEKCAEFTSASTTQMLEKDSGAWARDLPAGLPGDILPPIVKPGTVIANVRPSILCAYGWSGSLPVIAGASHDTASAVAAIPGLDDRSAFISSGTWSLMGVELDRPIASREAWRRKFTNEGGAAGKTLLLRNLAGLWLVQECLRHWELEGGRQSLEELLLSAAAAQPMVSLIDPDAEQFVLPANMPQAIRQACIRSGQPPPETPGAIARCCLESLALRYRSVVEDLEAITGRSIDTLRIAGGGCLNRLLCQFAADACQRTVVSGPVEASALGNIMIQAIATGHIDTISSARECVRRSTDFASYFPDADSGWEDGYLRFLAIERKIATLA